jgi:hypothetical protein
MVQLELDNSEQLLEGRLIYRRDDYAFDFECASRESLSICIGNEGVASLGIGTLQIEVGISTRRLCYVWGYFPLLPRYEGSFIPQRYRAGGIKIKGKTGSNLTKGIGIQIVEVNTWPVIYDTQSHWICIGSNISPHQAKCVEFASNVVAVITRSDELIGLWLHPYFV